MHYLLVYFQVLSTRLFGKTTDLKLKAMTIIHSSTTETVRLPGVVAGTNEAGVGTGAPVVVHPVVVRSKLPLQRRIRHNESSSAQRKPHKKVIAKKKKPLKSKKKNKEFIDYSAVKENPLEKTSEEDPLGKVRNWLLNSHDISGSLAVRKSKSSPAGFLQQGNQPRSPGKVQRLSEQRGSLDANGKEQVKLQVVYKPPFKFSVKLKKPTEVATTVVKEINSKVNRRNRAAILIQNDNKRKLIKAKRKMKSSTEDTSKETTSIPKNLNFDCSEGFSVSDKLKEQNKESTVSENKALCAKNENCMIPKTANNREPVYENTPIYQNLHEMSSSKVELQRTSSVNCVSPSRALERGKSQKITRHHSVDGKSRDRPRNAQEDNKRYSIATDKCLDSVRLRLPHPDNVKNHSDVLASKRHSVPLLDSDTDSNLHTMPSDLEVLLSESEYLFSDA